MLKRRGEDGQAALEMALLAPFLILLIFTIMDAAFLGYSFMSATNAVREGARCASVGGSDAAVEQRVRDTSGGFASYDNVIIVERGDIGENVEVEATFTYDFLIPTGLLPGVSGSIEVTKSAAMRMEQSSPFDKECETGD